MGIRKHKKDHLRELAQPLEVIETQPSAVEPEAPLCFWTRHEHPTYVDLNIFADGDSQNQATASRTRRGGFAGRPSLITELAPALKALLEYAAPRTVGQYVQALRDWWRLFDKVEADARQAGIELASVQGVADVGELHRQRAFDDGMDRGGFGSVLAAVNIVRTTKGIRALLWQRPEGRKPIRHLPPEWQVREVRLALKHGWFAALDRWQTAEELVSGRAPVNTEEERLLRNYEVFLATSARVKHPRPSAIHLWGGMSPTTFTSRGFYVADMMRGFYPDAEDIRYAFHLCLASTGWNPAVLLSLSVDNPFVEVHPKDPSRYLLRGYKARSKSEQQTEGLYKSQGSAGVVLETLVKRTEPLRTELRKTLLEQTDLYEKMLKEGAQANELTTQRKLLAKLRAGVSSPWLYVAASTDDIVWLDPHDASYTRGATSGFERTTFLETVISKLNAGRPPEQQVAMLTAGDFRDAFAAYAYRISGGMILYVMKALGHKNPRTTQRYLDNTLLNDQGVKLYQTFSNSLWHEIRVHGRLDPTVIAMCSRDGGVSDQQRGRLDEYRGLRKSRIGVGCKEPTRPPGHIAPNFRADGEAMCHVHRCTLCVENAVILPESLPGLAKRLAELRAIQARMSTVAFVESSFGEELENTELVLLAFERHEVETQVAHWEHRIASGLHRIVDLDGLQVYPA